MRNSISNKKQVDAESLFEEIFEHPPYFILKEYSNASMA